MTMMNNLLKIADSLDNVGLIREANEMDAIIISLASKMSAKELEEITGHDLSDTMKEMVTFELRVEPHKDGSGNVLKAIPRLHDKWTDGLFLGDASQYNL